MQHRSRGYGRTVAILFLIGCALRRRACHGVLERFFRDARCCYLADVNQGNMRRGSGGHTALLLSARRLDEVIPHLFGNLVVQFLGSLLKIRCLMDMGIERRNQGANERTSTFFVFWTSGVRGLQRRIFNRAVCDNQVFKCRYTYVQVVQVVREMDATEWPKDDSLASAGYNVVG